MLYNNTYIHNTYIHNLVNTRSAMENHMLQTQLKGKESTRTKFGVNPSSTLKFSFSWALFLLPFNEIETQERTSPLIPWLLTFLLQPLS